jgi:hypothetical protein
MSELNVRKGFSFKNMSECTKGVFLQEHEIQNHPRQFDLLELHDLYIEAGIMTQSAS